LRPDNCTFDEYQAWFQDECNAIVLRPGFSVVDPKISAVNDPAPPWSLFFAIIFNDGMYIRIYEHYRELPKRDGGGGGSNSFPTTMDCVVRIGTKMDFRRKKTIVFCESTLI
jgi:hypothetical protein